MNKEIYQSAMGKVKAGVGFSEKIEQSLNQPALRRKKSNLIYLVPATLLLFTLIYAGLTQFPGLSGRQSLQDSQHAGSNETEEFEILKGNTNVQASYISVVYLGGYAYEPSDWLRYSMGLSEDTDYEALKGKKLGEVTLDLKGKRYKGTPPDFSSTYDAGTEIFEIKDVSTESGILVKLGGSYTPFYRDRKSVSDTDQPIGLTLSQVFNMLSKNPEIVSIELRSEDNGSWMQTSQDTTFLSLANTELPEKSLLNYGEIDKDPYASDQRIPINLIFADGRALHMQVFPTSGMAWVFGGFIPISEELGDAFQSLHDQESPYPLLSDLIPYSEEEIEYLYLKNHTNGDEVVCKTPAWSRSGLFNILSYYRAEETEADDNQLVMTAILGKTESDSITINFLETADKRILTEIEGVFYKPVRGQLLFKNLESFLYNQTDLGM
jgi:hypothetical protein